MMILLQTLLHPPVSVTVTEYVPAVLTLIQFVVAPVLHKYVAVADKGVHNWMDCPLQIELLPVIVHIGG